MNIPLWTLFPVFAVGAIFGVLIMSLCCINDRDKKKWWEE